MENYVVVAPVVVCKVEDDQHGYAYKHLQSGTPVPAGVDPQWISGHLANGMITVVPKSAPPPVAAPLVPEPPPPPPPPLPAAPAAEDRTSARGGTTSRRG